MLISDDQLKAIILKTGVLDETGFQSVVDYAKNSGITLTDALVQKDVLSEENLGMVLSDYFKLPLVVLSKISIPEDIFHVIPERIARKYKVIPFAREGGNLKLAMVDPTNALIQETISRKTGEKVQPHLAMERDVYNALRIYRRDLQKAFDTLIKSQVEGSVGFVESNAPIEKIVDLIINYSYQDRASDVHIEPQENTSLVRFRIDGILHDVLFMPKGLHDQVVSRIKVLSRLRTDEHLSPQDGKMRVQLEEEDLDIRVSILPISEGEKVVMRLLASRFGQFSLIELGMTEEDLKKVQKGYTKSYGMVLSTGPTGSGKTSTIYSILRILNTREKNITTIEDPVEYRIKGLNQIHVNPKTNLTFAAGLRSILRQDPNIVFVGEIRDNETAGIAVNAALTGHLVLSTLHTNDAVTALPRLTDMDVEPFLVASTVNVIIAQRLVRKICEMCKASIEVPKSELLESLPEEIITKHFGEKDPVHIYKGAGCKVCHLTGYAGRIGVYEVLEISKTIRELISKKSGADMLLRQAQLEGMNTMLDDGLKKVVSGVTSIEEVLRVTKVEGV